VKTFDAARRAVKASAAEQASAVATLLHPSRVRLPHWNRRDLVKIGKDHVVCIDYTIRLANGQVVETSIGHEPLTYLHGRKQIVPGVEKAIDGLESGASIDIVVTPEEAYGDRDPAGVFVVPRGAFPADEEVGPGMMFSAHRPDGRSLTFRVVEANDELVLVDTNHPLAGETLHISVLVHEVRNATAEEIYSGRPSASVHTPPQYLA
jgi:FKBP-type peptidyl-prolyl cis-trans isomerase SlyD